MLNEAEVDKKTKEFIGTGKLPTGEYNKIVHNIIHKIYEANFTVVIDTGSDKYSRIEWDTNKVWIRIFPTTKPIHNIWNILHEYGHYISGKRPSSYTDLDRLNRETEAWDNALNEIKANYPLLLNQIEDFNKHKEGCLREYYKQHEELKNQNNNINQKDLIKN